MKVMILEINGKEAVALDQDGRFVKIHNLGYRVGQELHISPEMIIRSSPKNRTRTIQKIAALAACFCILLGSVLSFLIMNSQSYGYVSVDVNPSIEYRINRFDRVVSVSAVNNGGENLISSIGIHNLEGADIEVALSLTIHELSVQGYFTGEDAGVLISSSADSEKASAALNQKLVTYTQNEDILKDVEVITAMVSKEIIEEAKQLGTTAGKLHLIKSIGDDVNVEYWIDKPVSIIQDAVKEHSSTPIDPETEINTPPEVTVEPETSVDTDEEPATSDSVSDTTDEPDVTTDTIDSVTETDVETETDAETETETKTEKETETESEIDIPTDPDTDTEKPTEELTWPETWPDEIPSEWPEEWPEPETDDQGNIVLPEPEKKPWWWWLWELIFGKPWNS